MTVDIHRMFHLKLQQKLIEVYIHGASEIGRSFLFSVSLLLLCLSVEGVILGWRKSSAYRLISCPSKDTVIDWISYILVQLSIMPLIFSLMTLGVIPITRIAFAEVLGGKIDLSTLHPALQIFLYLILVDFLAYWCHRLHHSIPALWSLHKFHHSATEFNMITVARDHPLERGLNELLIYMPLALVAIDRTVPLWLSGILGAYGLFKHSMVPWYWGWLGKYVFQAPVYHRVHHSFRPDQIDKNFGNVLGLWDHVFGTFYHGEVINSEIGISDMAYSKAGYLQKVFLATKEFTKQLTRT